MSPIGAKRALFGGDRLKYYQNMKRLFGTSLIGYWPLWEQSGLIAYDQSGNSRNGTYAGGVVLANVTTPANKPGATFDGVNEYVDITGAPLIAALNPDEGTFSAWVTEFSDFGADTWRYVFDTRADANNYIKLLRSNNAGEVYIAIDGSSTAKTGYIYGLDTDGWAHLVITWSKSNNRARIYLNEVQFDADVVDWGVFAGAIMGIHIGAIVTPLSYWKGNICDAFLLNREATAAEILKTGIGQTETYTILGDSIETAPNRWVDKVIGTYPHTTRTRQINRAVSGHGIVANMATQVTATAGDDADIIIIALGTNDDNDGNMTTLQATYEAGIIALKASNPRATIYSMNVLPVWADAGEGAEVDKGNIRTAIAAACTAQGITCWDTYSTPWIAQAETSDGKHPSAVGGAAMAVEVLARI